ncbi:MAG TPA: helix-turn-helix domain-containing protein [Armatimonadota bacterium]|jgi:AcrR family transcriptional regulator
MNKKELILTEAKRLFGHYGYLGFTLKMLAVACRMTSPALYYFYSSKADLFRDCLLSEFEGRQDLLTRCAERSTSVSMYIEELTQESINICNASGFRVVRAMDEVIHLPEEMQEVLRAAWDESCIAPIEMYLSTVMPDVPTLPSRRLMAMYFLNFATFVAEKHAEFGHDDVITLSQRIGRSLELGLLSSTV